MNPSGSTLGKYEIIREIARSNDIVYEAYDPVMNRRVAIKELNIPSGSSAQQKQDRIDRFKREAKALGTLQHPNIMTIYDFGQDGDRNFIVMEFLDGATLREKMDEKGKFEPAAAFAILKEVLQGLGYAHSKGIIHRDIKPDNIQILSDGRVKITDFGIARLTFDANITQDGQTFGTPSYMSPEQVIGKDIDSRSDLFSVGVIAYEMLSGEKPFSGDSVVATSHAILNSNPRPIDGVSYYVESVVHKALEKLASQRYQTADEMIQGMDGALSDTHSNPWGTQLPDPFATPAPQVVSAPPPVLYNPATGQGTVYAPQNGGYGQPSPYGQTYPQVPVYNQPYTQPGVVNGQYPGYQAGNSQYGYVPNPGGQPIFVARPKKPVSPETKSFLTVLFWTILLMLTVVFVLIIAITAVGGTMKSMRQQSIDYDNAQYVQKSTQNLPLNRRIDAVQKSVGEITSPIIHEEQARYLANLYAQSASISSTNSDFATAEEELQAARKYDPQNHDYAKQLAKVYAYAINTVRDAQNRALLSHQAAIAWISASDQAPTPIQRFQFQQNAASADIYGARELADSGNFNQAEAYLSEAVNLNISNVQINKQIQSVQKVIDTGRSDQE